MRTPLLALAGLALAFVAVPAHALPGEADAVIAHCGRPAAEHQGVSQVTNRMQRDLYYGQLILHFQPEEGGWSFTTAWEGHLPMTRSALESRLPCFREALTQVAQTAPSLTAANTREDPTIARQTAVTPIDSSTFGIPHLWLILVLAAVVLVLILAPGARRRRVAHLSTPDRPYRRPNLVGRTVQSRKTRRLDE